MPTTRPLQALELRRRVVAFVHPGRRPANSTPELELSAQAVLTWQEDGVAWR